MDKKTPEEVMREAEALIRRTERDLAATAEIFQDLGLDVRKLQESMGPKERAEAEALFRKDMEDVEREVAEELARRSFAQAAPRTGGARKMRNMI
ncbi:Btc22 family type III secretion system chaperone [Castellaniella defragrans]|uniref:Uncharacterized protein n=1 Tax=Castellaniella defragrans TaxID=75697 RepID=A0A7W9TQR9_CASDE|nr:hypothetical protein [Castellaniella defragrans]KAB0602098.1 hypothetical protein F7Q88_16350 [Castellaniella defragrans]MBB6084959.1 hypothetical protein [Castellaniella defragrans]